MNQDQHLWPVLAAASRSDLEPIATLAHDKSSTFTFDPAWPLLELQTRLEVELRENGGNSFINLFRPSGPEWSEIVRDVADKVKVPFKVSEGTVELEQRVALHILERAIDQMTPEQKAELMENLQRAGLPRDLPLGQGALMAGIIAGNIAGFAAYQILVVVANAVAKVLLGRGLALAANVALTRLLALALGPVGWALTAVWTILDVAGPAYRITIPSVVMIAVLRAQQAES